MIEWSFSPRWLSVGINWDTDIISLSLPFFTLSVTWPGDGAWPWCWTLARVTIWKTEFRLDLDLNVWLVGINLPAWDDFGIYLGPFNIQIETDKGFNDDFPPEPLARFFFPPGYSIQPWPPRCRCCPPTDRLQCDDVTDFVEIHNR